METISYRSLRQSLQEVMDNIVLNRVTYEIVRSGQKPVVMVSKRDFNSINETLHLLSNFKNAQRLHGSIKQEEEEKLTRMDDICK